MEINIEVVRYFIRWHLLETLHLVQLRLGNQTCANAYSICTCKCEQLTDNNFQVFITNIPLEVVGCCTLLPFTALSYPTHLLLNPRSHTPSDSTTAIQKVSKTYFFLKFGKYCCLVKQQKLTHKCLLKRIITNQKFEMHIWLKLLHHSNGLRWEHKAKRNWPWLTQHKK